MMSNLLLQMSQMSAQLEKAKKRLDRIEANGRRNTATQPNTSLDAPFAKPSQSRPAIRDPTLHECLKMMKQAAEGQRFAAVVNTVESLRGTEGRSQIAAYFSNFESMTRGWSSEQRADFLSTRLLERAKTIYDSLNRIQQSDYAFIKDRLLNTNASTTFIRLTAQNELMNGVRPKEGESIYDYGLRILQVTRDASIDPRKQSKIWQLDSLFVMSTIR